MDPFKVLPIELHREILQHFKPKDFLIMSLVCKDWYCFIGDKSYCMRGLSIYYQFENEINITPLLNSTRKYQHLRLKYRRFCDYRTKLSNKDHMNAVSIMRKFSSSLVTIYTQRDFRNVCELPALKKLTFSSDFVGTFPYARGLLSKIKFVEELKFLHVCRTDEKSFKAITRMLKKNAQNLKCLSVNHVFFDKEEGDKFCFSLKQFEGPMELYLAVYNEDYIFKFFLTQASTLQVLKTRLISLERGEWELILSAFPCLHSLELMLNDYSSFTMPSARPLPVNNTIKFFKIKYYSCNFLNYIKSVKNLEIDFINYGDLQYLTEIKTQVTLKYYDFDELHDHLPDILEERCPTITFEPDF